MNKTNFDKCQYCNAEKESSGYSLHCWDIKYKCGYHIIGIISEDGYDVQNQCKKIQKN